MIYKCKNCTQPVDRDKGIIVLLKERQSSALVCSTECRAEWLLDCADVIREAQEEAALEATEGRE